MPDIFTQSKNSLALLAFHCFENDILIIREMHFVFNFEIDLISNDIDIEIVW